MECLELRTVAAIGTDEDFNLDRLMAKATDFHTNSNTDEAKQSHHGFAMCTPGRVPGPAWGFGQPEVEDLSPEH
jgi:hypothetical protein